MQTSRFQLGLVATLALGLGVSIASSDAVGYPAGAAVSMGTNPVWSVGGNMNSPGTVTVVTAPTDSDLVITDVYLSSQCTNCAVQIKLTTASEDLASYRYWQAVDGYGMTSPHPVKQSMVSGLRAPAGETLSMSISSHYIDYTFSGYHAQR
mgnify:CR=1 FL=1